MKNFKDLVNQDNNPATKNTSPGEKEVNQPKANLTIHSIFTKDISYEAPSVPQVFSMRWEPQVKFDIQVMRRALDQANGLFEVILHTTVATKVHDKSTNRGEASDKSQAKNDSEDTGNASEPKETTAFVIDLKLAGIFTIEGLDENQLDQVLSTTAPTILFPYVTETIASLVTRGGFPQFILPPIDFVSLYQQKLLQKNDAKKDGLAMPTSNESKSLQ